MEKLAIATKGEEIKFAANDDVRDVVAKDDIATLEKKEVTIDFKIFSKVEVEDAVAELCVDVECLCVEMVEDVAGRNWWRWSVYGGLYPMKEEKIRETFWRQRTVHGEHESTR